MPHVRCGRWMTQEEPCFGALPLSLLCCVAAKPRARTPSRGGAAQPAVQLGRKQAGARAVSQSWAGGAWFTKPKFREKRDLTCSFRSTPRPGEVAHACHPNTAGGSPETRSSRLQ